MGIRPLKGGENFRTYFWVFLFSFISLLRRRRPTFFPWKFLILCRKSAESVSPLKMTGRGCSTRWWVPKWVTLRLTWLFQSICKIFQKKSKNISEKSDFFGFLNKHIIKLISDSENSGNFTLRTWFSGLYSHIFMPNHGALETWQINEIGHIFLYLSVHRTHSIKVLVVSQK